MSERPIVAGIIALVCAILALSAPGAGAVLVDWSALSWAPGSLSHSFDVDPGGPGNDVTVTFSGNTGKLTNDLHTGLMTPEIDTSLAGGQSPVVPSLDIAANLYTKSKINFGLNFINYSSKGVNDVTFTLFDIDISTNKDEIVNIYGIALDGSHVGATITSIGGEVSLTGTGLAQALAGTGNSPDSGVGSDGGNATITFGNTAITGFSFTYANSSGAPKYQQIGVGNIYFSPIPEADSSLVIALMSLGLVSSSCLKKRETSKVTPSQVDRGL
jgi:hypothetical protein